MPRWLCSSSHSKVNDAEAEAAETQSWIACAVKCDYLSVEIGREQFSRYEELIRMLVSIRYNASQWIIPSGQP